VLLTSLIVPLGFLTLAMSFVWLRGALVLAKCESALARSLLATITWFSRLPRASYRIPSAPAWLIVAFFVVLCWFAYVTRARVIFRADRIARRRPWPRMNMVEWSAALSLLFLTFLVATHPFAPSLNRGEFEVTVLDVGQGDSIFTAFPDGRTMLVDAGGLAGSERVGGYRSGTDVGEDVVSPYLWSRGIKRLDVIALTHAHHDHLDGFHAVLENFKVGELWVGRDEETPAFESLLAEARDHGVEIVHKQQGDSFEWGGVKGKVLWPPLEAATAEASNDDRWL